MRCLRLLYLLLRVVLIALLPASAALALELADILAVSRVTPPARVEFQEERHSPLFDEALLLSGYLEYLDYGVLHKVIESPFSDAFMIDSGEIRLQRDGETRQISLERRDELATIIGGIEAILSGEASLLESLFDYEIFGSITDWSIELKPKSRSVARRVPLLSVSGDGDSVVRILIDLRDGERQIMNILHEASER
ncbi:MAG TPA: LolA-related protein [Gammaproteobacteria bacterium]|nr:LolA-related protein [Gammaproteobacteria bacterium]